MTKQCNPSIKFLHYRYPEITVRGAVTSGWESRGGRTFAYRDNGNGSFDVSVSKCHLNDNFNKKLARDRAAGRMLAVADEANTPVTIPGTYEDVLNYCNTDAGNYGMLRKFAGKVKVNQEEAA